MSSSSGWKVRSHWTLYYCKGRNYLLQKILFNHNLWPFIQFSFSLSVIRHTPSDDFSSEFSSLTLVNKNTKGSSIIVAIHHDRTKRRLSETPPPPPYWPYTTINQPYFDHLLQCTPGSRTHIPVRLPDVHVHICTQKSVPTTRPPPPPSHRTLCTFVVKPGSHLDIRQHEVT